MSDDEDRELRQKSKDNDRFEGDTINPDAALHSAEANTRMSPGGTGRNGSGDMGDDDVTLAGYGPDGGNADVSKQDDDPPLPSNNDVDEIARDLLQLEDEETARAIARVIVRTGDVVGDLAASLEDDGVAMNDRMTSNGD